MCYFNSKEYFSHPAAAKNFRGKIIMHINISMIMLDPGVIACAWQ
jgi:hypothetical protein